jgi:VWFA-related protein
MKNTVAVLALVFSATGLFAQVSETIEVRITNIDAVVTDRAGNPITGLTKDDFEILENGKPQAITNFSEIRDGVTAQGEADSSPAAKAAQARRIVVFVDNASIHPHARTQALQAFESSLDKLMRNGDQATLVMWNRKNDVVVPLTADRAQLVNAMRASAKKSAGAFAIEAQMQTILENAEKLLNAAVKPDSSKDQGAPAEAFNPDGGSSPSGPQGGEFKRASISLSLEQAYSMSRDAARSFGDQLWRQQKGLVDDVRRTIDALAGIEGKKVLLYLGSELSEDPGLPIVQRVDALYEPHMRGVQGIGARDNRNMAVELRALAQHANSQDVTLYMVDTGKATRGASNDASEGTLSRASVEPMSDGGTLRAMSNVAAITGGISVPGGKAINTALETIARDLSSYYSLGYRAQGSGGNDRNVQVRAKNPAYRVRSRTTYIEKTVADTAHERLVANLFQDVRSDFDVTLTASAPEKQPDGRNRITLNVKFPTSITLVPKGENIEGQFGVLLVTGNPDGRMSKVSSDVQTLSFPKNARKKLEQQQTFEYSVPLLVGSGELIVSVGITDQIAGSAGFAKTKIVIP